MFIIGQQNANTLGACTDVNPKAKLSALLAVLVATLGSRSVGCLKSRRAKPTLTLQPQIQPWAPSSDRIV